AHPRRSWSSVCQSCTAHSYRPGHLPMWNGLQTERQTPIEVFTHSTPRHTKLSCYNNRMLTPTQKIWHNGRFIPWDDAQIHVLSHVVSYGSSVFEGIRCYATGAGPAIFRLRDHIRRMLDSAKIYRMENIGFNAGELEEA